ncbi:plasmid mobilization protein [Paludibaculum fermentans]|uniref:plasmid mobilization protein n=1 Tax=Paludibaculum fermentans TaxID=1473598 RepID=UPI003EB8A3D5
MAFRQKQSGSETRKRAPIIGFRATDAERAQIEAAAQRAGLTVGSYVRSRALAKPVTRAQRRPAVETQQLAHLLGMLGVLSGMLQAVVKKHGRGDVVTDDELKQAMAGFREAVAAILVTMGKHPTLSKDAHDH